VAGAITNLLLDWFNAGIIPEEIGSLSPSFFSPEKADARDKGRLPKSAAMDVATACWQASPVDLPFLFQFLKLLLYSTPEIGQK